MDTINIKYDCSRGTTSHRSDDGELACGFKGGCCKLNVFDWMCGVPDLDKEEIYEVRFKNTRKLYFRNETGISFNVGDIVVVEAVNGHDVGIVTIKGPVALKQLKRHNIDKKTFEFKKIYR